MRNPFEIWKERATWVKISLHSVNEFRFFTSELVPYVNFLEIHSAPLGVHGKFFMVSPFTGDITTAPNALYIEVQERRILGWRSLRLIAIRGASRAILDQGTPQYFAQRYDARVAQQKLWLAVYGRAH